jgi:hypothetical protein
VLRASFSFLSFLKFQMIYGTWSYFFEIYVVCWYLVHGFVCWVRMLEEKVSSIKTPKVLFEKLETLGLYGEECVVQGWKTRLEECVCDLF